MVAMDMSRASSHLSWKTPMAACIAAIPKRERQGVLTFPLRENRTFPILVAIPDRHSKDDSTSTKPPQRLNGLYSQDIAILYIYMVIYIYMQKIIGGNIYQLLSSG